ncbi:MAG: MgtC/SapB family protein [Alphaproteobacteria bacterium]|nr:MgtC/SapB family protein [Alphaproteobacteria bacterium]
MSLTNEWLDSLFTYWRLARTAPDLAIILDMGIALFLGFVFGYERSYHGRAAGMRTYGLVCMVSAVLISVSAHPSLWVGGHSSVNSAYVDPTRTIQGIMTGIGFLGAGIIMQNGMKISGLTTAASIWAAAAIGVLVGLGFYFAATSMTIIAELFVMLGSRFDVLLPTRRPVSVTLQFEKGFRPPKDFVKDIIHANGYELAKGSLTIQSHHEQIEWRFVAISKERRRDIVISDLAEYLPTIEGVESFHLARARN